MNEYGVGCGTTSPGTTKPGKKGQGNGKRTRKVYIPKVSGSNEQDLLTDLKGFSQRPY